MKRALLLSVLLFCCLLPSGVFAASFGATYSLPSIPKTCANRKITVPVTVTNTGTLTWSHLGATAFHLSYHWYQGGTLISYNNERSVLPQDVPPNGTVTVQANLVLPSAPGTYTLKWDMVEEGITWFSGQGVPTGDEGASVQSFIFCIPSVLQLQPQITSASSEVWPGQVVIIQGNFFFDGGTVALVGNFGTASEIQLPILLWKSDVIGVIVPDGITGVPDQSVILQVRRNDGGAASISTSFLATRTIAWLFPGPAVAVQCSQLPWRNQCNGVGDDPIECCDFHVDPITTLEGTHQDYNLLGVSDSDSATINLKNDWVTYDIETSGNASVSGFQPNAATNTITASWSTNGYMWDIVRYAVDVEIVGPVGVPIQ